MGAEPEVAVLPHPRSTHRLGFAILSRPAVLISILGGFAGTSYTSMSRLKIPPPHLEPSFPEIRTRTENVNYPHFGCLPPAAFSHYKSCCGACLSYFSSPAALFPSPLLISIPTYTHSPAETTTSCLLPRASVDWLWALCSAFGPQRLCLR